MKYLVCNGDEGDPGAFMDRMLLESYPYRVLEGMAIAAFAVGATKAYSISAPNILWPYNAFARPFTGANGAVFWAKMLGIDFTLHLRIMEGAGAFVCGEETALLASIEGRRGMPRLRPPYPAERGLWGKPTCINNVETYALVPWMLRHGAEAFAALGTAESKGTKVFALTGKVARGGLIEVPMGITIREIVEEIGGGIAGGRRFKAVQIGGPSGGCIPAELADTPIDYESLTSLGAIMGSGGLVVLDETTAWWILRAISSNSPRTSHAATAPSAAWAPGACWISWNACAPAKARPATWRSWKNWHMPCTPAACAASGRPRPTRC